MKFSVISIFVLITVNVAHADSDICKSIIGSAYNIASTNQSTFTKNSFKSWQCSQSFSDHNQAIASGLSVGVPIYGVPVKVDGKFDKNSVDQWKNDNCSSAERSTDSQGASATYIKSVAPQFFETFLGCVQLTTSSQALQCSIAGNGNRYDISASWKRSVGEPLSSTPKLESFTVIGGNCAPTWKLGDQIQEGINSQPGKIATCATDEDDGQLSVLIGTSRGSCQALNSSDIPQTPHTVLSGNIVLTSSTIYHDKYIDISPDMFLVTNGNQLSIIADKQITIKGAPQIISFPSAQINPNRGHDGKSGGIVLIQTPKLIGDQLFIDNHGEDGLVGKTGDPGGVGDAGPDGDGNGIHGIYGCEGAVDGGAGGKGKIGGRGDDGGNGGNGGPIIIQVGSGLQAGAFQRIVIQQNGTDITGHARVCSGSCGGRFGLRGPAGPGGPGGPGGHGGSGHDGCGGSGPGPQGPTGDTLGPGKDGKPGSDTPPTYL